jgi:hypothetical protein
MFPHAPLPRTVDSQPGRIIDDIPRITRRGREDATLERALTTAHRTVVRTGRESLSSSMTDNSKPCAARKLR